MNVALPSFAGTVMNELVRLDGNKTGAKSCSESEIERQAEEDKHKDCAMRLGKRVSPSDV